MCSRGQFFIALGALALIFVIDANGAIAQDPLENAPLAPESARTASNSEKGATTGDTNKTGARAKVKPTPFSKPDVIIKSPVEWRKLLTRMQYAVTREKMTEQPFTGKYASGHFRGTFVCVCCDAAHVQSELFSSQTKFDSGTGWPSFYQAYSNKSLQTAWDYSEGEPRLEVMCRRCGAHLGHVFDDGPPPTGLRFCINSASIKLVAPEGESVSKHATGKTSSKGKTKGHARPGVSSTLKTARSVESSDSASSSKPSSSGEPANPAGSPAAPATTRSGG